MTHRLLIVCVLLTALLLTLSAGGCAGGPPIVEEDGPLLLIGPPRAQDKTPPGEICSVSVLEAGLLTVKLPFNAGTGYDWSLSAHSQGVKALGKPLVQNDTGRIGAPKLASFFLRVTGPNIQQARFELARPWEIESEGANASVRTIIVKIHVVPTTL